MYCKNTFYNVGHRFNGIILTTLSLDPDFDFVSRYFAPWVGIPEDHGKIMAVLLYIKLLMKVSNSIYQLLDLLMPTSAPTGRPG